MLVGSSLLETTPKATHAHRASGCFVSGLLRSARRVFGSSSDQVRAWSRGGRMAASSVSSAGRWIGMIESPYGGDAKGHPFSRPKSEPACETHATTWRKERDSDPTAVNDSHHWHARTWRMAERCRPGLPCRLQSLSICLPGVPVSAAQG